MIAQSTGSWVSCPGQTVSRMLWARGIDIGDFRTTLGWSEKQCDMLFDGSLHLDEQVASDLAKAIGPSESFWIQRELGYRKTATTTEGELLKQIPIREMIRLGWVKEEDSKPKLDAVLEFFGVSSAAEWVNYWRPAVFSSTFKHTAAFESELCSVAAWLRRGELLAENIECHDWSDERALDAIPEIRKLTRIKHPEMFIPKLISICSLFGVAVVLEKSPSGCRATGATRWLSPSRALLLLSGRYRTDDHLWFAFFHELGHLVLHQRHKTHVEMTGNRTMLEDEADRFAQDAIVPPERWLELSSLLTNPKSIARFAGSLGVSRGLIVGQLQHIGSLPHSELNWMKNRFQWAD